jgi:PIN domain nuclease of toxin-antitoxin system
LRLLLDTHIWVWSVADPGRLAPRFSRVLEDDRNELWFSPISTWELILLNEVGRLQLLPDPTSWISNALAAVPLKEATLTQEVALASKEIQLPHRDPADRLIAATARAYDLILLTADKRLAHGKGFSILSRMSR